MAYTSGQINQANAGWGKGQGQSGFVDANGGTWGVTVGGPGKSFDPSSGAWKNEDTTPSFGTGAVATPWGWFGGAPGGGGNQAGAGSQAGALSQALQAPAPSIFQAPTPGGGAWGWGAGGGANYGGYQAKTTQQQGQQQLQQTQQSSSGGGYAYPGGNQGGPIVNPYMSGQQPQQKQQQGQGNPLLNAMQGSV